MKKSWTLKWTGSLNPEARHRNSKIPWYKLRESQIPLRILAIIWHNSIQSISYTKLEQIIEDIEKALGSINTAKSGSATQRVTLSTSQRSTYCWQISTRERVSTVTTSTKQSCPKWKAVCCQTGWKCRTKLVLAITLHIKPNNAVSSKELMDPHHEAISRRRSHPRRRETRITRNCRNQRETQL